MRWLPTKEVRGIALASLISSMLLSGCDCGSPTMSADASTDSTSTDAPPRDTWTGADAGDVQGVDTPQRDANPEEWSDDCGERVASLAAPVLQLGTMALHPTYFSQPQSRYCEGFVGLVAPDPDAPVAPEDAEICIGRAAGEVFRYPVCACGRDGVLGADMDGRLTTSSIDSRLSPDPVSRGAGVGSNGAVLGQGEVRIGGSTRVTGCRGVEGRLEIAGDTYTNGPLVGIGAPAEVDGDLQVGERAQFVNVGGTLYQPVGVGVSSTVTASATESRNAVIPNACDCDLGELPSIERAIADAELQNDNATLGFDLHAALSADGEVVLPCGRYFLDREVSVRARLLTRGRVAIFVRGQMRASHIGVESGRLELFVGGRFAAGLDGQTIDIGPGAEADIFATSVGIYEGVQNLGDPSRPAALRIYSDGMLSLRGDDGASVAANLFATGGAVVSRTTTLYGSVVASSFWVEEGSDVRVIFDRAVLDRGNECRSPAEAECEGLCGECGNPLACIEGSCGACRGNADCCSPLVCVSGECVSELI